MESAINTKFGTRRRIHDDALNKLNGLRSSHHIGKTTPWQGVTVILNENFNDIPVFKIQLRKGFRNKNKTTGTDTSMILNGLYAFGVQCGLDSPPLLYSSKRNIYALLSPPSFFKNLHFTEDKHLTDTFLEYQNEYRQCLYCLYADFSSLEKRTGTSKIPILRFNEIAQTHVTSGFGESQRNEFFFPGYETFNQPPFDERLPIQVTDDRENEILSHQQPDRNGQMQSDTRDEQNNNNINFKRSQYPDFEDVQYRLESYRGWPLEQPHPEALCDAGFFYTGQSYDLVRCFCCGIGLKDFSDTDNPLLEHTKHSEKCPFLLDHFGSREVLERYKQRFVPQDPEEIRRMQRALFQATRSANLKLQSKARAVPNA
ncbi:hypothetical protein DPMN_043043 [Dreissena polymorpha]|uniref:Uncharacterized protein n=1 Tax=Dreissena polymorpha TaxID=45954 RepID=A0A9D4D236_DREPO|nr:hypothetical protein DPMN_043043 [Dreissena polymorpha]